MREGVQDNAERWCNRLCSDHRVLVCLSAPGARRILLNRSSIVVTSPPAAGGGGGEPGRGWAVSKAELDEAGYRQALREVFRLDLPGDEYGRMPLYGAA